MLVNIKIKFRTFQQSCQETPIISCLCFSCPVLLPSCMRSLHWLEVGPLRMLLLRFGGMEAEGGVAQEAQQYDAPHHHVRLQLITGLTCDCGCRYDGVTLNDGVVRK